MKQLFVFVIFALISIISAQKALNYVNCVRKRDEHIIWTQKEAVIGDGWNRIQIQGIWVGADPKYKLTNCWFVKVLESHYTAAKEDCWMFYGDILKNKTDFWVEVDDNHNNGIESSIGVVMDKTMVLMPLANKRCAPFSKRPRVPACVKPGECKPGESYGAFCITKNRQGELQLPSAQFVSRFQLYGQFRPNSGIDGCYRLVVAKENYIAALNTNCDQARPTWLEVRDSYGKLRSIIIKESGEYMLSSDPNCDVSLIGRKKTKKRNEGTNKGKGTSKPGIKQFISSQ